MKALEKTPGSIFHRFARSTGMWGTSTESVSSRCLNDQYEDATHHQGDEPHQIQVKPGPGEQAEAELFIDHDCYQASDEQMGKSMNSDGCQPLDRGRKRLGVVAHMADVTRVMQMFRGAVRR